MIDFTDLPMEFNTDKWEINIRNYIKNTPQSKKTEELAQIFDGGASIYIQGDKNGVDSFYMEMAKSVWNDIKKYKERSIKEILDWIKLERRVKNEDFCLQSIDFSDFIYGYKGTFEGFAMTFWIANDDDYGYMALIAKYAEDVGWPIGIEIMFNN
jgi:hypothetical protein